MDKAAVDLVIVACATPDQSQPAVACMVQEKLGIAERQCPAFDVNSVCAGFVFALNVAQGMMLTDAARYRNVLVIGTDTFSKILNWKDRRPACSSATARGRCCCPRPTPTSGACHFHLGSDGRGASSSRCPAAARACRSAPR